MGNFGLGEILSCTDDGAVGLSCLKRRTSLEVFKMRIIIHNPEATRPPINKKRRLEYPIETRRFQDNRKQSQAFLDLETFVHRSPSESFPCSKFTKVKDVSLISYEKKFQQRRALSSSQHTLVLNTSASHPSIQEDKEGNFQQRQALIVL